MSSLFQIIPEQASTMAPKVDQLYWFIIGVTAFFGILVSVVVVYFAVKYRTSDPLAIGAPILLVGLPSRDALGHRSSGR